MKGLFLAVFVFIFGIWCVSVLVMLYRDGKKADLEQRLNPTAGAD